MAENEDTESRGTVVLDFRDRRRLAVAEIVMHAESNGGAVFPMQFGEAVPKNALNDDDVQALSDDTNRVLAKMMNG